MKVRALTFDLDGTLYDGGRVRWRYALRNLRGLKLLRLARRVREEMRVETFDGGEALAAEHARRVAERFDGDPVELRARMEELLGARVCDALRRAGPRPDARAALERAAAGGLAIGVVSDYAVDDKLAALGLDDLPWAARVAADATGALKPQPRAFEAAAAALGLPAPEICHVGDRVDTDVEGARAAGFVPLLLGGSHPGVEVAPTLSVAVERALRAA